MENLMKKYATVITAVLLVLASLIITLNSQTFAVKAGPGNGTNSEVKDMSDVYSVLDYVINRKASDTSENNRKAENEMYSFVADTGEAIEIKKHDSVTVVEDAVMNYTTFHKVLSDSYNGYTPIYETVGKSSLQFTRNLTIYMTEKASYYVSKGSIRSSYDSYEQDEDDEERFFNFEIQIYVDEDVVMIKFDKFEIKQKAKPDSPFAWETCEIKSDMVGKWIILPKGELADIFDMMDSTNQNTLSGLRSYIEQSILGDGDTEFTKDGDIYTLKDVEYTDITVDLSDYENPYIEFSVDEKQDKNEVYMLDTIGFFNIDNTVVEMNFEPEYVCENEEDFVDLFNGSLMK